MIRRDNIQQLANKNKKIAKLAVNRNHFLPYVPVVNLSDFFLDTRPLSYGLNHCFTDKNKFIKRNLSLEMETIALKIDSSIDSRNRENIHEYLRSWSTRFTNNIYHTKDDTFKKLNKLRNNKDIVVLNADKESCVVLMNRSDYITKIDVMINEGISKGVYE